MRLSKMPSRSPSPMTWPLVTEPGPSENHGDVQKLLLISQTKPLVKVYCSPRGRGRLRKDPGLRQLRLTMLTKHHRAPKIHGKLATGKPTSQHLAKHPPKGCGEFPSNTPVDGFCEKKTELQRLTRPQQNVSRQQASLLATRKTK